MMKIKLITAVALVGILCMAAQADVTVTIDEAAINLGWMNTTALDGTDGWGSGWGIPDLSATFDSATQVTMVPNSIGDPSPYWYTPEGGPGADGNRIMEANLYAQVDDTFAGQLVTFEYNVTANTLTSEHTAIAFIKDFAPDFSSYTESVASLVPGANSIVLATDPGLGRHVQYGIQMTGVDVWVTDLAPYGSVVVEAIPEPATLGLLGLAGAGLFIRRRFMS